MSEKLADVCQAMAKDIYELSTGRNAKDHDIVVHAIALYLWHCSTKGALHWEWVNSMYSSDVTTPTKPTLTE